MKPPDALSAFLLLLCLLPLALACSGTPPSSRPAASSPQVKVTSSPIEPQAPLPSGTATEPAAPAAPTAPNTAFAASPGDPHSFSRPDEVAVEHLALSIAVDFDRRQLVGRATLSLANQTGADRLLLDTRDLDIRKVTLDGGAEAPFTLGDPVPHLGRPLEVRIAPGTRTVQIDYATRPEAAALQWLTPEQAGSSRPFLYTQSQAILARTWVPCQDTPRVRMTYEAVVRVPADLLAVMSAENPTAKRPDGLYRFRMPQAIPSYLLALAVGDLRFKAVGPTSGVYALPNVVERAAWELADTQKMIAAAEKLYGPYRWGRYDVLILPASYPFGGMENPRLTFATPTILAGDRSLVGLVAHELAHSWSGNLVTNATWNDFWLNEGFTVYFERRILEAVYGRPFEEMEAMLGRQDLDATVKEVGAESPDTHLRLDLAGRDPDDGMTDIAYEKGALLLRLLEESVGRAKLDRFLREYFDTHAFQSMTTDGFLAYLRSHLLAGNPALEAKLKVGDWVDGPAVPANAPKPRSDAFAKVEGEIAAFTAGTPPGQLATKGWTTQEWLHFLRNLPQPVASEKMAALDEAYRFTQSGNSEVLCEWLLRAIESRYTPAYPALERFLTTIGRRKFLKPLYTKLHETPEGAEMALRIYEKARPTYHSVSQNTIDQILEWRG